MAPLTAGVRIFGIRHHGPGSARALAATLERWRPDAVLIEGPPEAAPVLALAADPAMRPPVALLGYLPGRPARSSFWPMAAWSPEWVALRHALAHGAQVSMIDLPATAFLSAEDGGRERPFEGDPLADLARAAGYDDTERWWEDMVEHRGGEEPWEAIIEAMAALRASARVAHGRDADTEARREASMRQHIRAAEKRHERVAVVCGAWHAPALAERGPARADAELLKGLPREKAVVTWVPWTSTRLSFASGYGAGVTSPGWYGHLFVSPDQPVERWMVAVAALLRSERVAAPPASVVDAVRLAGALATLRGRPLAGLSECNDAALAVLAGGHGDTLALIEQKLVIGDQIGEVPPSTPRVALAEDLATEQRRLRLKPQPVIKAVELDLRRDLDLRRSRLLHRLLLLSVPWGVPGDDPRGSGTFREEWVLGWEPELSIRVIEAGVYGTTVEAAATARAAEAAAATTGMAEVSALIERCLLADLPSAVPAVMDALDRRAAVTSDVAELMDAVPALARTRRYGSVRRTDAGGVAGVLRGLVRRVCVGLPPACVSLDADAARRLTARMEAVSSALAVLDDRPLRDLWWEALEAVGRAEGGAGLPAGRAVRLLLDAGRMESTEVADRLSRALSAGEDPARGAAWVEGLVAGSGLLLVHDRRLLAVVDEWVESVAAPTFDDLLPVLRRAFADFQPAERRMLGEAAARLGARDAPGPGGRDIPGSGSSGVPGSAGRDGRSGGAGTGWGSADFDAERAAAVLPLLRRLLGPGGEER